MPFMFPIPEMPDMGLIQKQELEEFQKNMVIKGGLSVSMKSVSGFLNPNNIVFLVQLGFYRLFINRFKVGH